MMRRRRIHVLWGLASCVMGCGDDGASGGADVAADTEVAVTDLSDDTGPDDVADSDSPGSVLRVRIDGPRVPLPGRPTPLVLTTERAFSGTIDVTLAGQTVPVVMRHGQGSFAAVIDTATSVVLATPGAVLEPESDGTATFDLEPAPSVPNDLVIDGEYIVAAGETLTIAAGQRVVLKPLARIIVHGTLKANGTADAPVLFTSKDSEPFGTLEIRGGHAELAHTWLTGGGGRSRRFGGHSDSDPVIAIVDGSLAMQGGGLVDNPGKALWAERAEVTLVGVTIARCDTGGEYVTSVLTMDDCHTSEIPDGDGRPDDDDNDGLYLRKAPLDADGNARPSIIRHSVFAFGEDDGIDHNGGTVVLDDVIVTHFRNEGLAASDGGRVDVSGSVFANNTQGIESGYGSPTVVVRQTLLTRNDVGLRWGDSYDWEALGTIDFANGIIVGNTRDIDLVDPQQGEAPGANVRIACSVLGDALRATRDGNMFATASDGWCPLLPAPDRSCEGPIGPEVCR